MVGAVTDLRRGRPHARLPGPEHAYGVAPEEIERLREMLAKRAHA